MKKKLNNLKEEFKKTLTTAIIAALGLLMALSWRDVIDLYLEKILSATPFRNQLISAIIVTLISTIIILIISNSSKK